MNVLAGILGSLCVAGVMLDAFQTIILPRRPSGRFRITRLFYVLTWTPWGALADRVKGRAAREQLYSTFGPLSLLFLLILWAVLLSTGFGFMYYGLGTAFSDHLATTSSFWVRLRTDLYVSGTTLFTLGLGDVVPLGPVSRSLVVLEAGTGLAFVAMVIGYVPVLYQAFSRREVSVAMLDSRAGSPPTATELLRRHGFEGGEMELIKLLAEWERWAAEILESHISYPILCYYRSQHDNQSWLSALVSVMDACALLITTVDGLAGRQAQLTFALARHALVDLGHIFKIDHQIEVAAETREDRLSDATFGEVCEALGDSHIRLCGDPGGRQRLRALRELYEPQAQALSAYLRLPLPRWITEHKSTDLWRRVSALRRGEAAQDVPPQELLGAAMHVSAESAAMHLQDEQHGL